MAWIKNFKGLYGFVWLNLSKTKTLNTISPYRVLPLWGRNEQKYDR